MASPQREDGHVDIANEIIEALAKIHLSSYESQILWAIFRKTYGWQKKEDWITNSQIAEMTEIAGSHVSRTIKILIQRNMVTKNGKNLGFQKDYEKWVKLPKGVTSHHGKKLPKGDIKLPKGVIKITKGGIKSIPKGVYTKDTKDTITKDTIQKKSNIFINTLNEFKNARKKNGKKMTDYAIKLLLMELNKLSNNEEEQVAILNQSIVRGWQGVFPLKKQTTISNKRNTEEEILKIIGRDNE